MNSPVRDVSRDRLLELAGEFSAGFGEIASATETAGDVPTASIDRLRAAGLLRVFQPRGWGGLEAEPQLFFDIQNLIAQQCASTAWVYGVLATQSLILGYFDERAQRDVWGEDGETLVCSSLSPAGHVEPAEGGYRLSGRWSFASGSSHAQWILLAVGQAEGGAPGLRVMLVPRRDFTIDKVWNAFGLRGTGSNDIVVENAFVPAHRVHSLSLGIAFDPAASLPQGELYRIPSMHLFSGAVANFSIGAARGGLNAFLKRAKARSAAPGAAAKDNTALFTAVSRLAAEIDAAEATFRRNFATFVDHVRRGEPLAMAEALPLRLQLTSVTRRLAAGMDALMLHVGAGGLDRSSPITRAWLDITAARVHPGNDPTMTEGAYGALLVANA